MPIELSCTGCGRTLRVADDAAGKHARCPACGNVSRVPEPAGAAPASSLIDPHSHGVPSGYAPPKPTPSENPFADVAPAKKPSPFEPHGVNPFGDVGYRKETGNPYQAPTAYGYSRPGIHQYPLASRGKRFAGAILDSVFLMLGAAPGFIMFVATVDQQNDEVAMIGMGLMFLGMFIVGVVNWVMITQSGQSIAKRMLGMRIIRADNGDLPGFVNGVLLRSWVPALINQVCNQFSLIDALWIFNEERRCIHDLIAQTIVIDV